MHTQYWLMVGGRIRSLAFVVVVDSQPVHLASTQYLIAPNNWHIILRLASNDAGVASRTRRLIDDHTPLVPLLIPSRQKRIARILILAAAHERRARRICLKV